MNSSESNEQLMGGVAAVSAYVLWGIIPIYWKLIDRASADEVLAQRIVWSFVFMLFLLLVSRSMPRLLSDIRELAVEPRRLLIMIGAAIFISVNWYTFIWAVEHDHVVQASLGYYINPLVSVLLGLLFLKEKLSLWQAVSFLLALVGVLLMAFRVGTFPWISLTLAFSFGLYGLLKKTVHLRAATGLAIETFIAAPVALAYLLFFDPNSGHAFSPAHPVSTALLIGSGVITAVPLLLFAAGANRISLTMIGFFQFIAPTLMLILGTVLYHEPFDRGHLFSFILIWLSLILFSLAKTRWLLRLEHRVIGGNRKKNFPNEETRFG